MPADPESKSKNVVKKMAKLDEKILTCALCRLCESRTHAVPGDGRTENVELMIVGEGPGRNEDLQGKPFVGAGGRLLDSLLEKAGLKRDDVYITNIVKCRPPGNRKPKPDEIEICTLNYLEKQVDLLKPLLICTLGATALEYFTGEKKMGVTRGKLTTARNKVALLPTYHPAAILRNPNYKALLEQDIKKIPEILKNLRKKKSEGTDSDLTKFFA